VRGPAQHAANRGHGWLDLLAPGLRGLDIGIDRPIAPLLIQMRHERQQAGGLAGLTRGMEQEVFLLVDEAEDLIEIPARQRR
jgi:hypothetical protein